MLSVLFAFALADEGVPAGHVALRDLMVGLPACDARPTSEPYLDFDTNCVDGLCPGASLDAFIAVYGEPDSCSASSLGRADICTFGEYINVHLDEGGKTVHTIFLRSEHPAKTADGLGIGSPLTCFVDRWGDNAISVDLELKDGRATWDHIHFREPAILVSVDETGRANKIQLSGRRRFHRVPPTR